LLLQEGKASKELSTIEALVVAKVLAGSLAEGMTPGSKEKAKKSRLRGALLRLRAPFSKARSKVMFLVKSHPLGGIATSPLSDPFTRADRLIVQVRLPAPLSCRVGLQHTSATTLISLVNTNCTALSLNNHLMLTWFATSPLTDNCPQPKEAQPLSQLDIRLM
jgi:hypothetical protein